MPSSDADSDSYSDIEAPDLDENTLALIEGRAPSQATQPPSSSYATSESDVLSSPRTDPLVDDEGYPMISLTQEESAVLDALEEEFLLSQGPKLIRSFEDESASLPPSVTHLRGKRPRPMGVTRSVTQPSVPSVSLTQPVSCLQHISLRVSEKLLEGD